MNINVLYIDSETSEECYIQAISILHSAVDEKIYLQLYDHRYKKHRCICINEKDLMSIDIL